MVFDLSQKKSSFSRQKTGSCRFVNSGRYPSEKKSSNRRVERVVSRQIEEKKDEKKKHTSFLSIEEKQFALAIFAVFSS